MIKNEGYADARTQIPSKLTATASPEFWDKQRTVKYPHV